MGRPFDDHVRDNLSNYEAQPSDLSWIAISAHLEAQRVQRRRKLVVAFSLASVVLLSALVGILSWNYFESAPRNAILATSQVHLESPEFSRNGQMADIFAKHAQSAGESTWQENPTAAIQPGSLANGTASSVATSPHKSEHKSFWNKLTAKNAHLTAFKNVTLPETGPFLLEDGSINEDAFEGFKIGLMGGMQSGYLGGNVIDNFMSDRQISKKAMVRPLFGLSARYDFSSSFGLETNLIISSGEGQLFEQYGENKNLSLNYIRIPVLANYRFTNVGKTGKSPHSFNLSAGLQYGRLNWVNLDDFGNSLQPGSFNNNELGFAAGVSYDQYISEGYLVTIGARGSVNNSAASFPKVFSSKEMINYNVGLYVQLNFAIQ